MSYICLNGCCDGEGLFGDEETELKGRKMYRRSRLRGIRLFAWSCVVLGTWKWPKWSLYKRKAR